MKILNRISVKVDRVQFVGQSKGSSVPALPGFRVVSDFRAKKQTSILTYQRIRWLRNAKTKTKVLIHYQPACPWLAPQKLTVFPEDSSGATFQELKAILRVLGRPRLHLIELALDFSTCSGVDKDFIRRCALFGKSRPIRLGQQGSRRSAKFVRYYYKRGINAFRVELQLQSAWLRLGGINRLEDFANLPALIVPRHLRFVHLHEETLANHLRRRGLPVQRILSRAKAHAASIHEVQAYLRKEVGIHNPHRFLRSIRPTNAVLAALKIWAKEWQEEE